MPFRMPSTASIAFAALAAAGGLAPALGAKRDERGAPSARPKPFAGSYEGVMGGEPATALAAFETHPDYAVFSGELRCGGRVRSFTAEIFGNGGFGHLEDRQTGEIVRIHVGELSQGSFILTINALAGAAQSSHCFERRIEA